MSTITADLVTPVVRPQTTGLWRRVSDVLVLTGRNLVHIAREPLQLSDVTIQPVLFTLLFVYVFGAGVVLPDGGSYKDFAIAGLLALNLTTSSMGTAVGLTTDLNSGVIDRFRTLPMWRAAVLVGRSIADLLTAMICTLIVALTGLAVGWRADSTAPVHCRRLCHHAPVQLRPVLGLRLPGPGFQGTRVGSRDRPRHSVPARHRVQRPGSDAANARSAARDRELEPGQRRDRRLSRSSR